MTLFASLASLILALSRLISSTCCFLFQLYISSLFRLGYGDVCFVINLFADVVPIDGVDIVEDILPTLLAIIEDVVSKCNA